MFTDARSKTLLFVAHCVLNQNSISDGTASYPGSMKEIMEIVCASHEIGVVQLPCPELLCLGLDRGNPDGGSCPVVEENTRIRRVMSQRPAMNRLRQLVRETSFQISEYRKHGFEVRGIIGINRSPSCGVESTSKNNREVAGEGVFIAELRKELEKLHVDVKIVGINSYEPARAAQTIRELIGTN
jgi:predicted secreted protein